MPKKTTIDEAALTGSGNEKEKLSLEDAFLELDDIIKTMEDDKISLEDSFNNYKKGLELIKYCNVSIGTIEGELEILESGENE